MSELLPFDIADFVRRTETIFKGLELPVYGSLTLEELELLQAANTDPSKSLEVLARIMNTRLGVDKWSEQILKKLPSHRVADINNFFVKEMNLDNVESSEGNEPQLTGALSTGDSISTTPTNPDLVESGSPELPST